MYFGKTYTVKQNYQIWTNIIMYGTKLGILKKITL